MIKKYSFFIWGDDEKEAFKTIKQAINNASSLATPNFSNSFILYTFASNLSYATILTQSNEQKFKLQLFF